MNVAGQLEALKILVNLRIGASIIAWALPILTVKPPPRAKNGRALSVSPLQ